MLWADSPDTSDLSFLRCHQTTHPEQHSKICAELVMEDREGPHQQDVSNFHRDSGKLENPTQILARWKGTFDPRLLDGLDDAVMAADEHFILTAWNKAAEEMYGWKAEEALGRSINEITGSELTSEQINQARRILDEIGDFHADVIHNTKDGKMIYVEVTFLALRAEDGRINGYISFNRDLKNRRQAEALRESEDRYRDLVEHSHDLICTHDTDGLILSVNQMAANIMGYNPKDFVNKKNIRDILIPEVRDQFDDYMKRLISDGIATGLMVVQNSSGEKRIWEYRNTLRTEGVSKPIVRGIAHDVTESKRTEAVLRQKEEWFKGIFEGSKDAIFLVDASSHFVGVNQAACNLTGYSREELLSMRIPDLHEEEDLQAFHDYFDSIMKGQELTSEAMILRKDRKKLHVEFSNRSMTFRGIPVMHTTARDVSDRKRLEERVQQLERLEAIGRLAGGVAHDFNNLLTAILGYSELLLGRLNKNDDIKNDDIRGDIEEIEKAGMRAAALTSQLLAFSRKQIVQPRVINLNSIVDDLRSVLQSLIGDGIELVIDLDHMTGSIKADPGQIEQAITNLAVNAREAMPEGGELRIETRKVVLDVINSEEHAGMSPGSYAMIAVIDNGKGMDTETQSHIFEPFFTTREPGKGIGLGLSSVYGIVKQNDGYIWSHSEVGRGTIFKIYLPQIDESAEKKIRSFPSASSVTGSETILLVEDEDAVRKLALHILQTNGYTVLEAANAREALLIEGQYKDAIHLLITDMVMPRMGGRELSEKLIALRPDIKVIYMSGYTDSSDLPNLSLKNRTCFIHKPFSPVSLLETVRSLCKTNIVNYG